MTDDDIQHRREVRLLQDRIDTLNAQLAECRECIHRIADPTPSLGRTAFSADDLREIARQFIGRTPAEALRLAEAKEAVIQSARRAVSNLKAIGGNWFNFRGLEKDIEALDAAKRGGG